MQPITIKEFNAYVKKHLEDLENPPNLWKFLTYLSFNNNGRVSYKNNTLIVNVKMEFVRNDRQSEDLLCKELAFKDMHFMQDISIDKIDNLVLHIDDNVIFKSFLIKSIYEEETKGSINSLWIHKDFKCKEFIIMNYHIFYFCLFAHNIYGDLTFNECECEEFHYHYAHFNYFNFYGKLLFFSCIFKNNAFTNSIFHNQVDFKKSKFYANSYFDNATFKESADFHECEFEKVACFYGATFEKVPNFSQAIFKGNLNLVNAKLDFDFEDVEKKIKEEYSNHIGTEKEKFLDKFANDFRDSFRLFKNALIKDNNLLEASNHHRIELYCKEIELDFKNRESQNQKGQTKDWIDKWVLRFYRHTSDHHTDLLKILNNIMMLIALFGIFSLVLVLIATNENPPETLGIVSHIWDFSQVSNIQNQQKIFYVVGQIPTSLEWNDYCGCKIWGEVSFIFGVCIFFILAFLGLLCLQKCVYIYRCVIGLSYLIVLVILAIKPALLLPIFGKLLDESLKVNFPAFTSLSIVYAILMFLLLFSLQKTARKNSIVPS